MSERVFTATIDDGTKEIPLVNKFGKLICKVYIRPADFSILDRYDSFVKDFSEIVAPLSKINIKNDGTAEGEEFSKEWKVLKDVENEVIKRFNILFDMDNAEEIFKTRNAFSSVGGTFFCENVLFALGDVITSAVEEESEKSKARMEKYLQAGNARTTTNQH